MSKKKIILSGMRPTGELHLGHLVGALDNWVKMQSEYNCFFMIADWHALMSEYRQPEKIKEFSLSIVADWLSCGINPEKSTVFIQSDVIEHLQLNMIFSCFTPLGWLERNPTYKEQMKEIKDKDLKTHAFLGYPVLQAADILLYKANAVPVGKDQLPHLELTREIARRFNSFYKPVFPEPEAILTESSKLLGLDNRKMSKSYNNYIALSDSPDVIKKKVESMFTDPKRVKVSDPGHPLKCNVYKYYRHFKPDIADKLEKDCKNAAIGCVEDKNRLAEILVEYLSDIRKERKRLLKDKKYLLEVLEKGAERASSVAKDTITEAKKAMKLI